MLIVGAGPAGLLLALLLARKGIDTHVVESAMTLDGQPRATHYGTPAVRELARAGVLSDIQNEGLICRKFCWRKLDGEVIAGLDSTMLDGTMDQVICLPLNDVSRILLKHLTDQTTARISWSFRVVELGQSEKEAWVDVETPEGLKRLTADYIVGCDGAKSTIRRKLFGEDFPGHTLDEQIVATNVSQPSLCQLSSVDDMSSCRLITTSTSLGVKIRTSSFTQSIGTWLLAYLTTVSGEYPMARLQDFLMRRYLLVSPTSSSISCPAMLDLMTTNWSTLALIGFISDLLGK